MVSYPLTLAIDTATGCGSVALTRGAVENGRLLGECTCQPEVSHSRRLLGSIEWLLAAVGVQWSDLDLLAVSLGPGSFTGLRIGLAVAKGIAMAADLPMVGVPTLDALALSCLAGDRLLCCLLDARKQEVYAGFYRGDDQGKIKRIGEFKVLSPAELMQKINEPVLLVGPGAELFSELVVDVENITVVSSSLVLPSAAKIGFLGGSLLNQGGLVDPVTVGPLYVRASEAEINLEKKNRSAGRENKK